MTTEKAPASATAEGVVIRLSSYDVDDTVARLRAVLAARGVTLFAVIDHAAAAAEVGLRLRPTTVLIFGTPVAGTPLMASRPLSALDLPLKVLVWLDDDGRTRVGYTDPEYLRRRYDLPVDLTGPLAAAGVLVDAALAS